MEQVAENLYEKAKKLLKEIYGYDDFHSGQKEIIKNILDGNDCLGIMPTGSGKSICYQIPALIFEGVTIVISPLISLMKDQVDTLKELSIPAGLINSSQSFSELVSVVDSVKNGNIKLLYVAPERLENESFIDLIKGVDISMVAIDEAHCVSQWGHDFRPSYLSIPIFIKSLNKRAVISSFTATATQKVKNHIVKNLSLITPKITQTGFDRKNLFFDVIRTSQKRDFVLSFIEKNSDKSGIIFTGTRKDSERIHDLLKERNYSVSKYHAGMADSKRRKAQEDFLFDEAKIVVATNAFGMGIDKSNVRYVIHYNMPKNLESYYQEAGRAGRDGLPAECIMLFSPGDVSLQKYFIDNSEMDDEKKLGEFQKLQSIKDYCHTTDCQRKFILEYFNDTPTFDKCDNCGSCTTKTEMKDITEEAKKILSCIVRMGERFGVSLLALTLKGSRNAKVLENSFDKLSTYAIMKDYKKNSITEMVDLLISHGYIFVTQDQYSVLKLTSKAKAVLKGAEEVKMRVEIKKEAEKELTRAKFKGNELFEVLREVRTTIAKREGVPPYIIFNDSTLVEMSIKKPANLNEFSYISGVGDHKLNKYGDEFVSAIKSYCGSKSI